MNTPALPAPLDVRLMNWTASVLFIGCALFVLAATGRWVLSRPVFAIQRIVVQGDLEHNTVARLRPHVQPSMVGNFFTVDLAAMRAAFEQVPWVRRAQIHREYPGSVRVVLQEHQAVALWGEDTESTMLNTEGEVFDANAGELEQENLPRLIGPQGHSIEVLTMYRALLPVWQSLGLHMEQLMLKERGGWRVALNSGATIELGGGPPAQVLARVHLLARTLPQVAAQYHRRTDALESADLRHPSGYALRLRGVTTVSSEQAIKLAAKSSQNIARNIARSATRN